MSVASDGKRVVKPPKAKALGLHRSAIFVTNGSDVDSHEMTGDGVPKADGDWWHWF